MEAETKKWMPKIISVRLRLQYFTEQESESRRTGVNTVAKYELRSINCTIPDDVNSDVWMYISPSSSSS